MAIATRPLTELANAYWTPMASGARILTDAMEAAASGDTEAAAQAFAALALRLETQGSVDAELQSLVDDTWSSQRFRSQVHGLWDDADEDG